MAAAAWLVTALLGFEAICCCGSDHENGGFGVYRSRKVFLRGVSSSSMNLGVSGVDLPSSVVFPVCGNVYPLGFYYVLVNVGQPPKPYFLDPDTGSDLTWLQCDAPCVRSTKLRKELAGKPLRDAVDDATLPLCWKGKKPFKTITDAGKYFKPLALRFGDKGKVATQFELPPESYLIISLQGNVCLGILNGTEVGLQNFNVIGDISMQDKMVIYDNEKQVIGWAPTSCERLPEERRASS